MERQDIYELLKKDHRVMEKLFSQILEGPSIQMGPGASVQSLFNKLAQEATSHIEAEEKDFYDLIKDQEPTRDIVAEGFREHNEIRDLMKQAQSLSIGSSEWKSKVAEMRRSVQHHVQEEEGEMFSKSQQVLSQQQASDSGMKFQQDKTRIMGSMGPGLGAGPIA